MGATRARPARVAALGRAHGALQRALQRALLLLLVATPVHAAIDLRNASVERLDNGLTVILLEDRRFPVASVQMLYRVGARDEVTGKTGLAHFLEHMAFRAIEELPGHRARRPHLCGGRRMAWLHLDRPDNLLRNGAEGASRPVAPDRGGPHVGTPAVAKTTWRPNAARCSPKCTCTRTIPATRPHRRGRTSPSFLAHPYRNNTIGWESDIEKLEHRDVVEFYTRTLPARRMPSRVVGDVDARAVRKRVGELFGSIEGREPTPLPRTVEPVQDGVRRIVLHGDAGSPQFRIAYRAPSANDPDFAAFLVSTGGARREFRREFPAERLGYADRRYRAPGRRGRRTHHLVSAERAGVRVHRRGLRAGRRRTWRRRVGGRCAHQRSTRPRGENRGRLWCHRRSARRSSRSTSRRRKTPPTSLPTSTVLVRSR